MDLMRRSKVSEMDCVPQIIHIYKKLREDIVKDMTHY